MARKYTKVEYLTEIVRARHEQRGNIWRNKQTLCKNVIVLIHCKFFLRLSYLFTSSDILFARWI